MSGSNRFRIVDKEDYAVDLEYTDQYALLHLPRVDRLTKTVLRDMLITTEDLYSFVRFMGYVGLWIAIDPKDTVLNKFAYKLGFRHLGDDQGLSVYQYEELV